VQCGVVLTLSVRKVEGLARGCIEIPHNFGKKDWMSSHKNLNASSLHSISLVHLLCS
jgi:hypothetical protein